MVSRRRRNIAQCAVVGGDASFAFVQALATELSSGKVELPGLP